MNRWQVPFLFLSILIAAATCLRIGGPVSARKSMEEGVSNSLMDSKQNISKFTVYDKKKQHPCTEAVMSVNIMIPYKVKDKNVTGNLTIPSTANVEGTCSSTISVMKLIWNEGAKNSINNTVTFTFINDHTNFSVFSIDVQIYLDKKNFVDHPDVGKSFIATSDKDLHLFAASATDEVHKCDKVTTENIGTAVMTISNVSLIAFNRQKDVSSRKERKCGDQKDDTKVFSYVLKDEQKTVCTMARMTISLDVTYEKKDGTTDDKNINVPINAGINGSCNRVITEMKLSWNMAPKKAFEKEDPKESTISFLLVNNTKNTYVSIVTLNLLMDENIFPDARSKYTRYRVANPSARAAKLTVDPGDRVEVSTGPMDNLFSASADNGMYSCANKTTLSMNKVNVTISDILLVAFDAQKDFASKKVASCEVTLTEDSFQYVVRDTNTEVACVLANMSIALRVPYEIKNSTDNATLTVPSKVDVEGFCYQKISVMTLRWLEPSNKKNNSITFCISSNSSHFFVFQIGTEVYLDKEHFPNAIDTSKAVSGMTDYGFELFPASVKDGLYECTSNTQTVKVGNIDLMISNIIFIAFNTDDDLNSKNKSNCQSGGEMTTTEPTSQPTNVTNSTESSPTDSPPSPAPEPEPEPDPSVKKYKYFVINHDTHVACIVANMTISLKISYTKKDSEIKETILKVPSTAKTEGTCGNETATMVLSWSVKSSDPKYDDKQNTMTFTFKTDASRYLLRSINLKIDMDETNFPDANKPTQEETSDELDVFSASLKNFYSCASETVVKTKNVDVTISEVTLTAFNVENSVEKKSVETCATNSGSDVGAIVGGVIGGVILIAIIVYVIVLYKRRRLG